MNFDEALAYMDGRIRFGWKLGLERFAALCERLGDPQTRYAVLHVAGTKGKGSTTALAAAILRESGCKVGAYYSPYVYDVRERVQVNGALIPREDFARLVTRIRPHVEELEQTDLGPITEFELKTAIGFCYFAEQQVDVACLEVGLGGRLDATNIVCPTVTVITNIGLDHTQILGETHALIAAEKAGILKPLVPCFTATDNPEALAVIERIAAERNVPLARVRRGDVSAPTGDEHGVRWNHAPTGGAEPGEADFGALTVATMSRRYTDLTMRMGGWYQRINAACAIAAAEMLLLLTRDQTLSQDAVRRALATTAIPGRLTTLRLPDGPLVVLDGAHNALAAQALASPVLELAKRENIRRILLVVGMLDGHEPAGVLASLAPHAAEVFACQPNWKRALPAEEIAAAARLFTPRVHVIPDVLTAALTALAAADPDDMVLITGSFYTVGEVSPDALTGNTHTLSTEGHR